MEDESLQYAVAETGQAGNELVDGVQLLSGVTQLGAEHELAVHLKGEEGLGQLVEEGLDEGGSSVDVVLLQGGAQGVCGEGRAGVEGRGGEGRGGEERGREGRGEEGRRGVEDKH